MDRYKKTDSGVVINTNSTAYHKARALRATKRIEGELPTQVNDLYEMVVHMSEEIIGLRNRVKALEEAIKE